MPVMPRPPERGAHRLEEASDLRVLPVVLDDRRPVGPDRAAAAACGQHRWPRRASAGGFLPVARDARPPGALDRAAAAACGQPGGPRRSPRAPPPPPSAGCDLLPGCRRDRLGRAAPGVPAAPDRVRPVPTL